MIPDDPVVWLVIVLTAGFVVALGLWLGRGIVFRKDKGGYSLEIEKEKNEGVKVGEKAVIDDGAEVGDIAAIKQEGDTPGAVQKGNIEVLKDGKIRGKTGDIVAIKISGK